MNNFLKVLKIVPVLSVYELMVFIFWLSCHEENGQFCLIPRKHLLILKILPVTLFKGLVAAFKNPHVTVKPAP
jgi:hypothetical protein